MNIIEYVPLAVRTEKPLKTHQRMEHSCMGLITETGEVVTELKRMAIYGKPLDAERKANIAEEIGDVMWYIAIMLDTIEADLESVRMQPLMDPPEDSDEKYPAMSLMLGEHVGRICMLTSHSIVMEEISGKQGALLLASMSMVMSGLHILAQDCGTTLEQCMDENIAKLRIRFPNAYSNEAAEGRADKAGIDARNS